MTINLYRHFVFFKEKISLVSQDTTLFDDTIRNNISVKLDATDEEIKKHELSFASEFIEKL